MTRQWANRQSPSRQDRIPVRDAAGALLGSVCPAAASEAILRGNAVWRGRGKAKYIMLMATASRGGWMIPPSTDAEPLPGRLFGQPRRHSRTASWRTPPTFPSTLLRASGGGRGPVATAAAGILSVAENVVASHESREVG